MIMVSSSNSHLSDAMASKKLRPSVVTEVALSGMKRCVRICVLYQFPDRHPSWGTYDLR
jgi:hypothetical protein